jgi:hypothetical protein
VILGSGPEGVLLDRRANFLSPNQDRFHFSLHAYMPEGVCTEFVGIHLLDDIFVARICSQVRVSIILSHHFSL